MSYIWETNLDDIEHVASNRLGVELSEDQCDAILEELDTETIEREALQADFDDRVNCANDELKSQLKQLSRTQPELFGFSKMSDVFDLPVEVQCLTHPITGDCALCIKSKGGEWTSEISDEGQIAIAFAINNHDELIKATSTPCRMKMGDQFTLPVKIESILDDQTDEPVLLMQCKGGEWSREFCADEDEAIALAINMYDELVEKASNNS